MKLSAINLFLIFSALTATNVQASDNPRRQDPIKNNIDLSTSNRSANHLSIDDFTHFDFGVDTENFLPESTNNENVSSENFSNNIIWQNNECFWIESEEDSKNLMIKKEHVDVIYEYIDDDDDNNNNNNGPQGQSNSHGGHQNNSQSPPNKIPKTKEKITPEKETSTEETTKPKKKTTPKKKTASKKTTTSKKKNTAKKTITPESKPATKKKTSTKEKAKPENKTASEKKTTPKEKPATKKKTSTKEKPKPENKTASKKATTPKKTTTPKKSHVAIQPKKFVGEVPSDEDWFDEPIKSPERQHLDDWVSYASQLNQGGKVGAKMLSDFSNRHEKFFKTLTINGISTLFNQLVGCGLGQYHNQKTGKTATILVHGDVPKICKEEEFAKLVRQLEEKDFKNMKKEVRNFFIHVLEYLSCVEKMDESFRFEYLYNLSTGNVDYKTVAGIPALWVKDIPEMLAFSLIESMKIDAAWVKIMDIQDMNEEQMQIKNKNLKEREIEGGRTFQMLNEEIWDAMMVEGSFCARISAKVLNNITPKMRSKVSPGCMASFKDLAEVALKNVSEYGDNVFSLYEGKLHDGTFKSMSLGQISTFKYIPVNFRNGNLKNTTAEILYSEMKDCTRGESPNFGEKLLDIPDECFTDPNYKQMFSHFNPDDYVYFRTPVLQYIIDNKDVLKLLKDDVDLPFNGEYLANVIINAKNFASLVTFSGTMAGQVLNSVKEVPKNIFEECDVNGLADIYTVVNDDHLTVDEILESRKLDIPIPNFETN